MPYLFKTKISLMTVLLSILFVEAGCVHGYGFTDYKKNMPRKPLPAGVAVSKYALVVDNGKKYWKYYWMAEPQFAPYIKKRKYRNAIEYYTPTVNASLVWATKTAEDDCRFSIIGVEVASVSQELMYAPEPRYQNRIIVHPNAEDGSEEYLISCAEWNKIVDQRVNK